MKTIYEYPIELTGTQHIAIHENALVVEVAVQKEQLCLWAIVDTDRKLVLRTITIVGTGHRLTPECQLHIGTIHIPPFVWHVFEQYLGE